MSSGVLSLRPVGVPPVIQATRGDGVPQDFWLELWTEWGTDGPNPGQAVELPLERFLSRLAWLRPACVRHDVGLDWDPDLAALVAETREQRSQLDLALRVVEHDDGLGIQDVAAVLRSTRFDRDLRPFQERDTAKLVSLPHGANFSVPGAGKTTVAYAVYEAERSAQRVQQMLVVAPLSAFDAWENEVFECFADGSEPVVRAFADAVPADAEVLLVNYHRLAGSYGPIAAWVRARPTLVLLDEAHRMKRGWAGQWGSACLNLAFLAARRDILTGTPAPQGPGDLIALLDFLWPGQALRVLPSRALTIPPPDDAGHLVAQSIAPIFVRTRKSELELTPPTLKVLEVKPEPLHAAIYEALRDQYAGQFGVGMHDRLELARMGDIVMYLLEAATNPHLLSAGSASTDDPSFRHPPLAVPPDSSLWELLQRYNQYETPGKFVQLAQLVAANAKAGRKTLIWSNFVRNLLALERMLAAQRPALIYGAIPSEVSQPEAERTREAELRRFREDADCTVMLANPASMSEGISLHHVCHDAVYLERTFNAGQYLQSVDRIHRLGLEEGQETRITFLITTGTIDEVVDARIREKADRLGQMLDDPDISTMALPSDEDYGPAIDSYEDLEALFAHLRGEA
jgi:superfamily II DNA or RNA helicase